MIIVIKVTTNSSDKRIEEVDHPNYTYKAFVNASAEKGKANKEVIALLAKEFNVSKSSISILKGATSSIKIIDILE